MKVKERGELTMTVAQNGMPLLTSTQLQNNTG